MSCRPTRTCCWQSRCKVPSGTGSSTQQAQSDISGLSFHLLSFGPMQTIGMSQPGTPEKVPRLYISTVALNVICV